MKGFRGSASYSRLNEIAKANYDVISRALVDLRKIEKIINKSTVSHGGTESEKVAESAIMFPPLIFRHSKRPLFSEFL